MQGLRHVLERAGILAVLDGLSIERAHIVGLSMGAFATFYFGEPLGGAQSEGGRLAAEHIQAEVCQRTDLSDCRSHPRTWDLLRLTTMPAVWVEMGYLSHPGDAARLTDPRFRDTLAEAIAVAVTGFFAPAD